jgi:hypothetical protein
MPYLDAALAFALTMLGLAIVTTNIVLFLVRGRKREQTAKALEVFVRNKLGALYREQRPKLEKRLNKTLDPGIEESLTDLRRRLLTHAGAGLLEDGAGQDGAGTTPPGAKRPVVPKGDGTNAVSDSNIHAGAILSVSAEELVALLRRTEFGEKVTQELGDEADAFFEAVADRYLMVKDFFRARVRTHARLFSMAVASVLALTLNINAFTILATYITDPQARAAALGLQPELTAQASAMLEQGCADLKGAELKTCAESLNINLTAIQADIRALQPAVPMGWRGTTMDAIWSDIHDTLKPQNLLYFLLGCFATGILAGLGTPFWYDVVKRLTGFTQKVRKAAAAAG